MPTRPPVHHPIGYQSRAQRLAARGQAQRADGGIVYDKRRWRNMRAAFIATHPLCVGCQRPATVADHIRPHRGNEALMWSWDNLQAMCKSCHDRKTMTEDRLA